VGDNKSGNGDGNNGNGELKPVPLIPKAPSYPAEVVQRALELVREEGVVYRAYNRLKAEMAAEGLKAPAWDCIWRWAKADDDVIAHLGSHEKRDMERVSAEVTLASAAKMLTAIEEDEKVSHAQRTLDYGISMDKVIGLYKVGQAGQQLNVQFNLRTRED
jgi:hypothetical protein